MKTAHDLVAAARMQEVPDSISRSIVNAKAKRRQYKRTASEADKVHG